jgi:hypothetical protein
MQRVMNDVCCDENNGSEEGQNNYEERGDIKSGAVLRFGAGLGDAEEVDEKSRDVAKDRHDSPE